MDRKENENFPIGKDYESFLRATIEATRAAIKRGDIQTKDGGVKNDD